MESTFSYLMSDWMKKFSDVLDNWIVITDKIVDREVGPHNSLMAFDLGVSVAYALAGKRELTNRIYPHLEMLIRGEAEDLRFIPGKNTVEEDLRIWAMKAGRVSVEFACVCEEHEELNTMENWEWVKECQEVGLFINDCNDLIHERFEDLIQCRRNKVLLTKFLPDVYHNWRDRGSALASVGKAERQKAQFPKPPCEKLMQAWEVINKQCGVEV